MQLASYFCAFEFNGWLTGRGPTGLRAWVRNRGGLENRSHVAPNIVKGHVGVTPDHIGLVEADKRTRANHRHKFRALGSSSTAMRQSFAVRTIGEWNKLPASAVEQDTPAAFKLSWPSCTTSRPRQRHSCPLNPFTFILHEEACELLRRQDKTRQRGFEMAVTKLEYLLTNSSFWPSLWHDISISWHGDKEL